MGQSDTARVRLARIVAGTQVDACVPAVVLPATTVTVLMRSHEAGAFVVAAQTSFERRRGAGTGGISAPAMFWSPTAASGR